MKTRKTEKKVTVQVYKANTENSYQFKLTKDKIRELGPILNECMKDSHSIGVIAFMTVIPKEERKNPDNIGYINFKIAKERYSQ